MSEYSTSASRPPVRKALPSRTPRHYAVGLVILIHAFAIWLLASGLYRPGVASRESSIPIALINQPRIHEQRLTVPNPTLQKPAITVVAEPDIQISAEAEPDNTGPSSPAVLTPPRPDLSYFNRSPVLSARFARFSGPIKVLLLVFVDAAGRVEKAKIATSCGEHALDETAQKFAIENWRFRPARGSGDAAVAAWTTVLVTYQRAS
jgi:TonB family protein